ncbi:translocation and assembly module lipoprotein TamL [Pontibacter lucknowensis]|uniref:Outer membrane protein assembly factor BamA n=1 Tax=Pontibacter lucknowensis TaxID=1077936 RepID=A0A1N7ALY9_9BACT|nr:BamA/TamA family outer membrane protein [Pontibacter lucknowensis]SIR40023.1 Outer membrane protein assembly factor BamA [Pontibacter lucknowensis]
MTAALRYTLFALCLALSWVLPGCSSTKTVPEGDALFAGFNVKINDEQDSSNRSGELETELSATVRPQPNASILGMRPKLWIYNAFYTEKEKGLKNWIQTKIGEPPVLLSEVDTTSINEVMQARLHNRGYFFNSVQSDTTIKKKKATITWTATVHEPYRIRNISYTASDSLPIHTEIRRMQENSVLKKGEPYDLDKMIAERARIDQALKNRGYYFFAPNMLIFSADTTVGNKEVDVLLRLKQDTPSQSLRPYRIDDIFINSNFTINDSLSVSDTLRFDAYNYIPNENYVRAKHVVPGLFLEKDSVYSRRNHLLTVSRLSGLSAYKFVNLRYELDTLKEDRLDAFVFMTPALKKSLRAEAQMVSKSNNLAGPGVTVSFRNRNAFRGSETLTLDLTGRFENQVGGRRVVSNSEENPENPVGLNSYELGAQASLTFPRLVAPFNLPNLRSAFVPKTRITLGYNFLNRVQFFQMNSFNASYGYNWRPKQTITHDFTPINLQYVRLGRQTEEFETLLERNPFLRSSFEEQFIIGSIYQHTFSTLALEKKTHQFFNATTLDVSGNLVSAVQSLLGNEKRDDAVDPPVPPRTIFNQPYSQYTRIDNDFRYYLNFSEQSQLATRLIAGVGYPYGNSRTMPYVKQFSIGGPNSIRAFRARSIGPGTYNVPDDQAFSFFDQVGDIKLEANTEYRFPIFGFFRGAVFVDAGNIWLIDETYDQDGNLDKPKFQAGNLIQELAVGTGFGLRIDIEFFVIRFDLGIPVRVPYLPQGERFVLDDFKFGFNPGPGEHGVVLNIAIGYPF